MEKRKLNIALEVLSVVSVTFPKAKDFINKKLKEKCFRGKIPAEEGI